jgi:uncharacterized protein YdbL (DUF1318 family)
MSTLRLLPPLLATLFLGACVTINIYFPAAAAEKAADKIIEGVWGENPAGQPKSEGSEAGPEPHSGLQESGRVLLAMALDRLIPAAEAAEPDININTPTIAAIQTSMQGRHSRLASYYQSGAIGLDRDGRISIRDLNAVTLRERGAVQGLVNEENGDRDRLYSEIANANGHPEWLGKIRSTFAARWIHNAPAGWWCQRGDGQWYQK